ncbi:PREDICTED: stress-related protein [Ipomoea nil]|uniref:stress-related protein n=1 Tax=Ipomoea nil TaxID=35883 RepID=UPI000900FB23|nr:PREDICTED: stress-related protein [Ipomoea nil]
MAEATSPNSQPQSETVETQSEEQRLKYLEFVQVAALHAILCAAKLYSYAKENLGPLKPGVQTVEGTVKTVVGPVYDKVHSVPAEVLKFVDRKMDESVHKIEDRVPPSVKQVSTRAFSTAQMAPGYVRDVVAEVKSTGVVETASILARSVYTQYQPAAKGLYDKYEPVAEQYASSAWRSLNQLPLVPRVTQAVAPKASYWSERYNHTVQAGAEKGYKVASYLPLVPTEKIAKLLSNGSPVETS